MAREQGIDRMPLTQPPQSLLEGASLFLDFDGTLVALADTPDAVVVPEQTRALLAGLDRALEGRVAIISGRDVASLRDGFGLQNIAISGSHGAEIALPGQSVAAAPRGDGLAHAYAALTQFAERHEGVLVEQKALGIGLHYRLAPQLAETCKAQAHDVADRFGLSVHSGKMIYELRGDTADKGVGLTALMQQQPFNAGRPVFIGDDVTDEDGFRAAKALGGFGIKVGVSEQTHASYALDDVSAVHDYLAAIITDAEQGKHL
ncbi:trehalose-phosphatase [Alterisphingorhabdus coralli]|uniref:Trehalose 6-phosphate phosphatase n=1 Tax=Alterisphingorhabdus coralli TaxID=3071408 RepID=A0AA97I1K1_9SPHN|nr:trehalose-phosphatase [Parasphingorhabdus sp. SCSIO 66989]WOE75483.1 trehalose-phosphatase [Parasphingorhabdus sp. SCSIO 66989]